MDLNFRETISFDDIFLVPRYLNMESRSEADISICGYDMPVINAPMDMLDDIKMIKLLLENNLITTLHRYFKTPDAQVNHVYSIPNWEYIYFAVGSMKKYKTWIKYLIKKGVTNFIVDMAHGDSALCVNTIKYIRSYSDEFKIIAGNVCTKSGYNRLEQAGASAIRVGISNESCCSTAIETGFGVSQASAIMDVSSIKNKALLIADGGIKSIGDMVKAIRLGADLCMMGKMFASTSLGSGESFDENLNVTDDLKNIKYKTYRGMASKEAREDILKGNSIEGVSGIIPYTGTTEEFLIQIKFRLQAALSYGGCKNWNDFKRLVKINKISPSGYQERLPQF